MKLHLTKDQRKRFADKIMDWGNLVFLGTVVTQIVSAKEINLLAGIAGVLVMIGSYYLGYYATKGGKKYEY